MNLTSGLIGMAERLPLSDAIVRAAIARRCARTAERIADGSPATDRVFAEAMSARAVAEHADAANAQHYEVPAEFFALVLGPQRKYSSCFYTTPQTSLAEAETEALRQTIAHAGLADGQDILELGCGWGSLTLAMAKRFPASTIVAMSNSNSQRLYIEKQASEQGLTNVTVVTRDINVFVPERQFDRIVSVEMFEHMMNWRALLTRLRGWLKPGGRFFLHSFAHRTGAYLFDRNDRDDWIAQHFFTGGVMPSRTLIRQYADLFTVEAEWRWSGVHYQRTAEDWLRNFDANREAIGEILRPVYGRRTGLWMQRWRWFFLATSGLFGFRDGSEWGVSHYCLAPVGEIHVPVKPD